MSYLSEIRRLLDQAEATQAEAIASAAGLIADALAGDHLWHIFGTGHAHILAEELFYRAGGLLSVNPILDSGLMLHDSALASSLFERQPGYARAVFSKHQLAAGDVILIASNSGANAAPVEAAMLAREGGLKVIALTSLAHTQAVPPRHPSGKKLYELANVVIDNGGCLGDAALEVAGLPGRIEATSTVIGAALLHWLEHEIVKSLIARGITPDIVISANVPGGDAHNAAGFERYRNRVRCL